MKTLLIVDDHPAVLEGLRSVLGAEGYRTVAAASAREAVEAVKSMRDIDAMVVDLSLSDASDGIDLIRELRGLTSAPVVIYTMHGELWNVALLVKSGVEGIVLKGDSIDSLLEAVRVVCDGGFYRSPYFSKRIEALDSTQNILSHMDIAILREVSDGVTNVDIADHFNVSIKTVEYHRRNIIKKLGTNNMTHAIQKAVRLGILSIIAAAAPLSVYSETPGPQAIDLGLSVRWADRNLGAAGAHEPGGYYAFGEVTEKDYYDWSTYIHCDGGDMFSQCDIGEESICGTEYDAARVLLGDDWRMPTAEEMEELIENCTVEFVTAESPMYVRFTASNGAYIDLPLAGTMSLDRVLYYDRDLTAWTGTFYVEAGEEDGISYYFNSPFYLAGRTFSNGSVQDPFIGDGSVHLGLPIRPVYSATSGIQARQVEEVDVATEIFTINGIRCHRSSAPGFYIRKQGGRTTKVLVK